MNVFDYVFYFETKSGVCGVVRADNKAEAVEQVENKYDGDSVIYMIRCSDYEDIDYGVCPLVDNIERSEKGYEYEININPLEVDKQYMDDWGAAFLWLDDNRGVEYNICYDNGECESAIYKTEIGDFLKTDHSTFSHYEIDFSDKNWRQKLVDEMECVALKFWERR